MNEDLAHLARETWTLYEEPRRSEIVCRIVPRLDSWMSRAHPDQVRLREFLDATAPEIGPYLGANANALELRVAMPTTAALISGGHDLDNYLFPLITRLGPARFASFWGTKQHGTTSIVCVDQAREAHPPDGTWLAAFAEPMAAKDTAAWRDEVRRQIAMQSSEESGVGALEVQIAFVVPATWNWATLWKPTIDSLLPILGAEPASPRNPNDSRVVQLGLHRKVEEGRRGLRVGVWWRKAPLAD